jgi:hypothetical protein
MRVFLFILFITIGCREDNGKLDYIASCGTDESPYYLSESQNDTTTYRVDFWWWRESSNTWVDTISIYESIELLNLNFKYAKMQFELNEIHTPISPVKYFSQKNYRLHAAEIDEWYWSNRDSVPFSLGILVYPKNNKVFPGAAANIPSPFFCIQENFLTSSTITHEAGHAWGGLFHTHQPDHTDGTSHYTGDLICDIRYHPALITESFINVSSDCKTIRKPERALTEIEQEILIRNWMSYTLFNCRSSFSEEQLKRIKFISKNTPDIRRAEIN